MYSIYKKIIQKKQKKRGDSFMIRFIIDTQLLNSDGEYFNKNFFSMCFHCVKYICSFSNSPLDVVYNTRQKKIDIVQNDVNCHDFVKLSQASRDPPPHTR